MDVGVVVLRLVHIMLGVFWAGTLVFVALFLEPSVREAGPSGAGVMPALMRRHFLNIMPVVAILTILSGIDLMRRVSVGFQPAWFSSPNGLTLSIGSVAAVVALGIGVGVLRASALKVGKLARAMSETPEGAEKEAQHAQINMLRARSRMAGRWVAGLLTVAVACMAVARYMG